MMGQTSKFSFNLGLNLSTLLRATESIQSAEQQIFDADFDYSMLPPAWRVLLLPGVRQIILWLLEVSGMGTPGMLFCRTRFIDDALVKWLNNEKQQVVCLGAGNDTRAYRIPGIGQTRYFEVDLPTPQNLKKEHLQRLFGELPSHVTFVPIDFNVQDLGSELIRAGYQLERKAFFIMEGVSQYITESAVDKVIKFAARSAPGSQIVFTYIKSGIIDGSDRSAVDERIMKRVARRGMPWILGLDQQLLGDWMNARGLELIDQAGANEYRRRYLEPVGRQLQIYHGERIVLGEVA
jgi:methyltransferase (TIGR00027 family)